MIQIVPMLADHSSQLSEIEKLCFSTPWSEKQILDELENPLAAYFAAIEGETVAGYIGSQTVLGEACVMNVAVHPAFRGRGVSKLLMQALVDHCTATDCTLLTLEVRESNTPALGLYRGFGFKEVGRRKNYYTAPKEDALIMTLFFKEEQK